MTLAPDVLSFLRDMFPNTERAAIITAFECVYSPGFLDAFVGSAQGKFENKNIALAISALSKVRNRLIELPIMAQKALREEHGDCAAMIQGMEDTLAVTLEYSKVYHRMTPETGGQDQRAYWIADRVHLAFKDLSVDPTFGTDPVTYGPSTAYGRVVQHALKAHDLESDWRRPAHKRWKDYRKPGSGAGRDRILR